ncbi:MAG: hypothetical protein HYR86_07650 [Candidatus Rokubacteria bacterium]|nr:hypothetical protein [Candidatus Rokubacteria bacterium]
MATRARVVGLECRRCHAVFVEPRMFTGCPACAAQSAPVNLTVKLDLGPLHGLTPERFPPVPRGLWRFGALLPVAGDRPVSLGEGLHHIVSPADLKEASRKLAQRGR